MTIDEMCERLRLIWDWDKLPTEGEARQIADKLRELEAEAVAQNEDAVAWALVSLEKDLKIAELKEALEVGYDEQRKLRDKLAAADKLSIVVDRYTVGDADFNDLYLKLDAYRNVGKGQG